MKLKLSVISVLMFLLACAPKDKGGLFWNGDNGNENPGGEAGDWLIPEDEVFGGGPGKDGIPSVDNPLFIQATDVNFLKDDDLVIAVYFEDEVKVYPHVILDWHEIVNDNIGDHYFALTYCPLTGTGINWNRKINGSVTEFGVSGLLYNSNLIPYDRRTDSNWSQIRMDCVNGELQKTEASTYPIFESTWETIKQIPNISVLSTETGFSRDYGRYPYGSYKTKNDFLIFPVSNEDDRLKQKDRVIGIIEGDEVKVYGFDTFLGEEEALVLDFIDAREIAVIGNKSMNYFQTFFLESARTYDLLRNQYPLILADDLGNKYDILGKVVEGPAIGTRLSQPNAFMGYWFAFAAFYPDLDLYQ